MLLWSVGVVVDHFGAQSENHLKMEKLTFYNSEAGSVIDIVVSVEDAKRAKNDSKFATILMNTALQSSKTNLEVEDVTENPCDIHVENTCSQTVNDKTDETPGESSNRWTDSGVLLLLETYREMEDKFTKGKVPHKKLWETVSTILTEKGLCFTGLQCSSKMRSLKKTYKANIKYNSTSGNDRQPWCFFEIMHELFSKKAWCSPVAIASSTGLSVKSDNPLPLDSENLSELPTPAPKKNIASMLGKRLRQKDEQEIAKEKRHKEKMEMDAKMLAVLQKLCDK